MISQNLKSYRTNFPWVLSKFGELTVDSSGHFHWNSMESTRLPLSYLILYNLIKIREKTVFSTRIERTPLHKFKQVIMSTRPYRHLHFLPVLVFYLIGESVARVLPIPATVVQLHPRQPSPRPLYPLLPSPSSSFLPSAIAVLGNAVQVSAPARSTCKH